MAVVSMKNLLAPATNPVHLVTILFVVVLFAVLRFSGGYIGVRSSGGSSQTNAKPQAPKVDFDPSLDPFSAKGGDRTRQNNRAETSSIELSSQEAEDFEKIMKSQKSSTPPRVAPRERIVPPTTDKEGSEAGLDDIEKTLGLR